MDDKTILILFLILNLLIWVTVLDMIKRMNRDYINFTRACAQDIKTASKMIDDDRNDILQSLSQIKKNDDALLEYYHSTYKMFNELQQTNLSSMEDFLAKISVKMSYKGIKKDETENRQ